MNPIDTFQEEVTRSSAALGQDAAVKSLTREWLKAISPHRYTHNFTSLGRPIIQLPQDMVAVQELIWAVKPDLIIETGIAHGGSLIQSAAMQCLTEYCDAARNGSVLDPQVPQRLVLGIDIDIREHNRDAIQAHPMSNRIVMIEGSSTDAETVRQVKEFAARFQRILVCLDSNHTHQHVIAELKAYAPLVSLESYCLVFDTVIELLPAELFADRPWGPGNSPMTAVHEFLESNDDFEIDHQLDGKLALSTSPQGYLKRRRG